MTHTIGHDSEFGLSRAGQIISALDAGIRGRNQAGRYFPDNMNQEIAINPANSLEEFQRNTDILLDEIQSQGYDLIFQPIITYPSGLEHRKAYRSGCNPDFNVWDQKMNISPDLRNFGGTRSCGGHVHLSTTLDHNYIIKAMDLFLGVPSLFWEPKTSRREMYGRAGDMRIKPYGVEYRTLSSVWVKDPDLRDYVYEGTHKAVEFCNKGKDVPPVVQEIINNHDLEQAQGIMDEYKLWNVEA